MCHQSGKILLRNFLVINEFRGSEFKMKEQKCSSDNSSSSGTWYLAFDLKHEQCKSNLTQNILVINRKLPLQGNAIKSGSEMDFFIYRLRGRLLLKKKKAGRRQFPYTRTQCHNAAAWAIGLLSKGEVRAREECEQHSSTDLKSHGGMKHWGHFPLWQFQVLFPGSDPVTQLKVKFPPDPEWRNKHFASVMAWRYQGLSRKWLKCISEKRRNDIGKNLRVFSWANRVSPSSPGWTRIHHIET